MGIDGARAERELRVSIEPRQGAGRDDRDGDLPAALVGATEHGQRVAEEPEQVRSEARVATAQELRPPSHDGRQLLCVGREPVVSRPVVQQVAGLDHVVDDEQSVRVLPASVRRAHDDQERSGGTVGQRLEQRRELDAREG